MSKNISNLLIKNGFSKSENGHILRIGELLWMEIDQYGFVELRRKREWGLKQKGYAKITLPNPVCTEKEINQLMALMENR